MAEITCPEKDEAMVRAANLLSAMTLQERTRVLMHVGALLHARGAFIKYPSQSDPYAVPAECIETETKGEDK